MVDDVRLAGPGLGLHLPGVEGGLVHIDQRDFLFNQFCYYT